MYTDKIEDLDDILESENKENLLRAVNFLKSKKEEDVKTKEDMD